MVTWPSPLASVPSNNVVCELRSGWELINAWLSCPSSRSVALPCTIFFEWVMPGTLLTVSVSCWVTGV